jgi:hypothetical protein
MKGVIYAGITAVLFLLAGVTIGLPIVVAFMPHVGVTGYVIAIPINFIIFMRFISYSNINILDGEAFMFWDHFPIRMWPSQRPSVYVMVNTILFCVAFCMSFCILLIIWTICSILVSCYKLWKDSVHKQVEAPDDTAVMIV